MSTGPKIPIDVLTALVVAIIVVGGYLLSRSAILT